MHFEYAAMLSPDGERLSFQRSFLSRTRNLEGARDVRAGKSHKCQLVRSPFLGVFFV